MKEPSVGIYIPAFNAENTISRALLSILNLDYKNFNIYVINDGSFDNTLEIINEINTKKKITIFNNKENIGLAKVYDFIFKISKEKYVSIYHSDDIYYPKILKESVRYLELNPNAAVVTTETPDINILPNFFKHKKWDSNSYDFETIMNHLMMYFNFLLTPSACFRASIIKKNNIKFGREKIHYLLNEKDSCKDLIMFLEILKISRIGIIPKKLMSWVQSENQMSYQARKYNDGLPDFFRVIDYYLKENINKYSFSKKSNKYYNFLKYKSYIVSAINHLKIKKYSYSLKMIHNAFRVVDLNYLFFSKDIYIKRKYLKWYIYSLFLILFIKIKLLNKKIC